MPTPKCSNLCQTIEFPITYADYKVNEDQEKYSELSWKKEEGENGYWKSYIAQKEEKRQERQNKSHAASTSLYISRYYTFICSCMKSLNDFFPSKMRCIGFLASICSLCDTLMRRVWHQILIFQYDLSKTYASSCSEHALWMNAICLEFACYPSCLTVLSNNLVDIGCTLPESVSFFKTTCSSLVLAVINLTRARFR